MCWVEATGQDIFNVFKQWMMWPHSACTTDAVFMNARHNTRATNICPSCPDGSRQVQTFPCKVPVGQLLCTLPLVPFSHEHETAQLEAGLEDVEEDEESVVESRLLCTTSADQDSWREGMKCAFYVECYNLWRMGSLLTVSFDVKHAEIDGTWGQVLSATFRSCWSDKNPDFVTFIWTRTRTLAST